MIRLIVVLSVALCLSARAVDPYVELHGDGIYEVGEQKQAEKKIKALERDFEDGRLDTLAEKTNLAIRGIIKIAVLNLKRQGHYETAREIEQDWRGLDGEIVRLVANPNRAITDFEPWSQKLALMYFIIEAALGYQLCYMLRITDLATFLWTPVVVFNPCTYGEAEFLAHFFSDQKYRGLFPTTVYWISSLTCSIATFGAGTFWVCGPVSLLIELGAKKVVAPKLGPWIYEKACK